MSLGQREAAGQGWGVEVGWRHGRDTGMLRPVGQELCQLLCGPWSRDVTGVLCPRPSGKPCPCQGPQQNLPSVCSGNEGVGLFGNTKTLIVFLIKVGWC